LEIGLVSDDLNETPALQFAQRAGFDYADGVTQLCFAFLVVNVEAFAVLDDLAELAMRNASDRLNDAGLLHLRGDHVPDTLFAKAGGVRLSRFDGVGSFSHTSGLLGGRRLFFFDSADAQKRLDTSDLLADRFDLARFFNLPSGLLNSEMKEFLAEFVPARKKLFLAQFFKFLRLHFQY
jgi:hypothetical protein